MRAAGLFIVAAAFAPAGAAQADGLAPPAATARPAPQVAPAGLFRLKTVVAPVSPTFRVNDPASMLRSGYGGALIDVFPFQGGKFHISAGGRLFGRAGRPRIAADPESLRYLPAFRAGFKTSRKMSPALLVGYGRTVDQGLAFGIDAGMVMGRLGATPDRGGRLNRRRLDSVDGRGRRTGMNEIARVTALYRF